MLKELKEKPVVKKSLKFYLTVEQQKHYKEELKKRCFSIGDLSEVIFGYVKGDRRKRDKLQRVLDGLSMIKPEECALLTYYATCHIVDDTEMLRLHAIEREFNNICYAVKNYMPSIDENPSEEEVC